MVEEVVEEVEEEAEVGLVLEITELKVEVQEVPQRHPEVACQHPEEILVDLAILIQPGHATLTAVTTVLGSIVRFTCSMLLCCPALSSP